LKIEVGDIVFVYYDKLNMKMRVTCCSGGVIRLFYVKPYIKEDIDKCNHKYGHRLTLDYGICVAEEDVKILHKNYQALIKHNLKRIKK